MTSTPGHHGTELHDKPTAHGERRHDAAEQEQRAEHVGQEDLLDHRAAGVEQRPERHHARRVDERVEVAVPLYGGRNHPVAQARVGHVTDDDARPVEDAVQSPLVAAHQHDVGAALGGTPRHPRAQLATGSDDRDDESGQRVGAHPPAHGIRMPCTSGVQGWRRRSLDTCSIAGYAGVVTELQGSLLDLADDVVVHALRGVRRTPLSHGAWVDVMTGFVGGADRLYAALRREVPWQAERRQMYDSVVDVPRLLRFYGEREPLPHPALDEARDALSAHYADELGEPFTTAGLCLYRDGHDSVAWHGDRIGRSRDSDTMVAILSVGAPRDLVLRPRGGGPSTKVPAGHGDLVVMGGSCQRTWDHCVPKTSRPVGPRISVQFRPAGVR